MEAEERIITTPNILSFLRIILAPIFLWMILIHEIRAAFFLFLFASLTDFFDGFIARHFHQQSKLGQFLDPAADKLLMTVSFIILSFPSLSYPNTIPFWLMVIVVGRDMLIVISALFLAKLSGQKKFPPTFLGKTSAFSQMSVIALVLLFNTLEIHFTFLLWFYILTLIITLASAVQYFTIGCEIVLAPKPAIKDSYR